MLRKVLFLINFFYTVYFVFPFVIYFGYKADKGIYDYLYLFLAILSWLGFYFIYKKAVENKKAKKAETDSVFVKFFLDIIYFFMVLGFSILSYVMGDFIKEYSKFFSIYYFILSVLCLLYLFQYFFEIVSNLFGRTLKKGLRDHDG